tara:strand:- start:427 stop:654 length:228 start_codon:yes stop_codon:yes gene_type:complete
MDMDRDVKVFADHWILFRTQEPNVPVLNGSQEDFIADLKRLVEESNRRLRESISRELHEENARRIDRLLRPSGEV